MKRWIHASISDEGYTNFINAELPEAIAKFMETPDEEIDFYVVRSAVNAYRDENELFPPAMSMEATYAKYDEDKGRFYNKYYDFAKRCGQLAKNINPSGYSRKDRDKLRMKNMMSSVEYNFPYGWKRLAGRL